MASKYAGKMSNTNPGFGAGKMAGFSVSGSGKLSNPISLP